MTTNEVQDSVTKIADEMEMECGRFPLVDDWAQRLRSLAAPAGEPVAWQDRLSTNDGWSPWMETSKAAFDEGIQFPSRGVQVRALYTTPPPAGEPRAWLCICPGKAEVVVRALTNLAAWQRVGYTAWPLYLSPQRITDAEAREAFSNYSFPLTTSEKVFASLGWLAALRHYKIIGEGS